MKNKMKMKKSKRKTEGKPIEYKGEKIMGEQIITCPKCNVRMGKKTNGKFIIDACPNCGGVFLDKKEIQNIGKQGFFNYVIAYFKKPRRIEK